MAISLRNRSYILAEGAGSRRRGDKSISRGLVQIYGTSREKAELHKATPKPKPRSKDWGSKAYKKVLKYAHAYMRFSRIKGISYTEKDLVDVLRREFKCSKSTAQKVSKEVFLEE